ncbi:MAG: cold shock domain-containing protein [Turneriella sp.]
MKPERAMPPRPGSMVPNPKPCGSQKEGAVKEYVDSKGQGVITETANPKDISFDKTGLVDQVKAEDSVCFDIADGQKGPRAVNIRKRTVRPQHIPVPPT